MAVTANPLSSRLQLRLITGQDDKGNPIYRSRSFNNVKPAAADQSVYNVGDALAGLQQHELDQIRRIVESVLVEED